MKIYLFCIMVCISILHSGPVFASASDDDGTVITVLKTTREVVAVEKGTFDVKVSWLTIETIFDYFEPLNGVVKFTPVANLGCENISIIQIARLLDNYDKDYIWQLGEAPRNEMKTKDGYFIDHLAWECGKAEATKCSPFYRDHWPNTEDDSQDGSSIVGQPAVPAVPTVLVDYPFGWAQISRINLEACAVCRATGENLGCYKWGGYWPMIGERQFDIAGASSTPSGTFGKALKLFTDYYSK